MRVQQVMHALRIVVRHGQVGGHAWYAGRDGSAIALVPYDKLNEAYLFQDRRQAVKIKNMWDRGELVNRRGPNPAGPNPQFEVIPVNVIREVS